MGQRGLSYGWVVLAASAVIVCVGLGSLFSLAVFLRPIQESTAWSRTGISTIALLNWIAMGVGSLVWGALSDRIGTRAVVLAGGGLLGLGLVLSSQVSHLWQLYLTFGGMVGLAAGAFYAPLTATATKWFTTNRGLAVSIVSSGIGFGILLVSPLSRWLTNLFEWRTAMLLLGDLAWLVVLPTALLIRERPPDGAAASLDHMGDSERPPYPLTFGPPRRSRGGPLHGDSFTGPQATAPRHRPDYSPSEVVRSPQFWAIALTHFACCAAHSGPIFHMVTHAIDQGVARMVAATVLSLSGLSSVAGRVGCGILADRFGARRTLLTGLVVQAVAVLLYVPAREVWAFYGLALIFGVAYGGVMPMYALVTRECFGERVMGTAYGAVFLISTLGMGLGSFAGGWIYDTLGGYAWMYVGSAGVGLAAGVLALTFRTPRRLPSVVGLSVAAR